MGDRRFLGTTLVSLLMVGLLGTGACSDDGSDDTVGPSATTTTTPVATTASPGTVTVRAKVSSVFASARVLQFEAPADGYDRAALTSDTEYRKADGSPGSLQDVGDGSTVEVTGEPGSPGTLLARLVVVVG